MIERAFHSGILTPGSSWTTLRHSGATALILYRIRVLCDANYFDTTCTEYCKPRDDVFGHYTCDENGEKVCHYGWMGEACQTGKDDLKGYYTSNQKLACFMLYLKIIDTFFKKK